MHILYHLHQKKSIKGKSGLFKLLQEEWPMNFLTGAVR